ncbi:chord-containing protein [Aulographum hederae CBS 113979]|uniref:Chord-containing protein n=1 Tax=Aulographum hederae CBS 113979 TaxID=1176131 RepID=A0A6G1GPL8_9PEZI|nr:chord-containing protein [Aulographum hederae CBS 113979]
MAQKCVHKGCGKVFTDPEEPCSYHPGPPEFHEGQKGWKCCKPRVLTFDEFLSIPPCTTGTHSSVEKAAPSEPPSQELSETILEAQPVPTPTPRITQATTSQTRPSAPPSPAPPVESDSDDPAVDIPKGTTCRRRACDAKYDATGDRSKESCTHHPGHPIFHEGSKGYTCCKRRVLEFDEFLRMEGCKTRPKHMFVGSGGKRKKRGESGAAGSDDEVLETVRSDFYQTPTTVQATLYLKKIDKTTSTIEFNSATTVRLDLKTTDKKRYTTEMPLFGEIDTEKSDFKIMGTKLDLILVKTDGRSWATLRSDEKATGKIIQSGGAVRV